MIASRVRPREQWSKLLSGAGFKHVGDADHLTHTLAEIWLDPEGRYVHVPYIVDGRGERLLPDFTLNRLIPIDA